MVKRIGSIRGKEKNGETNKEREKKNMQGKRIGETKGGRRKKNKKTQKH